MSSSPPRAWFDAGKQAFERVTGNGVDGYVCPLCVRVCTTLDDVTREDVPPAKIGGRPICLTCDECNHTSGHTLDKELVRLHTYREWSRGARDGPLRARTTFEGIALNADITWTPERMTVVGVPEHNNPANTAAQTQAFRRAAETHALDWSFTVSLPGVNTRLAGIALLRAAYLAAFAAFGYRYALRSELDLVRRQISNPDDELIERFIISLTEPVSVRALAWIERPRTLESLAVQIDQHWIVLPGRAPNATAIYERLDARKQWPPRRQSLRHLQWHNVAWPTSPQHAYDGELPH